MRHKKYFLCVVFAIASIPGRTIAQDLRATLEDMRDAYGKAERFHIVMNIKVYENSRSDAPFFTENADLKKDRQKYLYRFGANDMLMGDDHIVLVDKESKEMVITQRDNQTDKSYQDLFPVDLDSILALYEKPHYLGFKNDADGYRMTQKQGELSLIDLHISRDTHLIQSMEYTYRNGQFVSIRFEVFDIHPDFEAGQFDEGNYFSKVKGKFQVSANFKQYKLFETTDEAN